MQDRDWNFGALPAILACTFAAAVQLTLCTPAAMAGDSTSIIQAFTPADRPFWNIDEVRAGAFDHGLEDDVKERGIGSNIEVLGGRLPGNYSNSILEVFLTPRPHLGTTIGFGKTDELYWGLTWDVKLFGPTFAEASFGGAAHDGPLDGRGESSYGCRLNFHEGFSLGYAINERWRVISTIDHMSNGNLCQPNHGLTNAGLRLGYRF